MLVAELIKLLQRCPKDWIVMYNAETERRNEEFTVIKDGKDYAELDMSVDDVLVGGGTTKGFVFLTAEPYVEIAAEGEDEY